MKKITGTRNIITVIDQLPYLNETESKVKLMCGARAATSCLFPKIYLFDPQGIYNECYVVKQRHSFHKSRRTFQDARGNSTQKLTS